MIISWEVGNDEKGEEEGEGQGEGGGGSGRRRGQEKSIPDSFGVNFLAFYM